MGRPLIRSPVREGNTNGTGKFHSACRLAPADGRLSKTRETFMIRTVFALVILAAALPARADDSAKVLAPTGTLRAAYIATNPVQAFVDPATKEVRGPGAEITRELARRAGVPFTVTGAKGVEGVLEAVKNGTADIGFLAFDPVRAAQVDYSQNYSLAQNTYVVVDNSPIKSVPDADRAGVRVGVGARDAGDYFLPTAL